MKVSMPALYFFSSFVLISVLSCKTDIVGPVRPALTTTNVSAITPLTASTGGNITEDGGAAVTARGVCWGTSSGPTLGNNNKTSDGKGTGNFVSSLTNLTPGTTYYVRAFATNKFWVAYGNEVSFTTVPIYPPALTTRSIGSITSTRAISGGEITSDGASPVTARGVCWSTAAGPTIADSKTSNGTGAGNFVSAITNLSLGIKYYVRAYATNASGTSYGNEINFITHVGVYVAGTIGSTPTVWINGVATFLTSSTGDVYDASSVFVSGSDVYVAGPVEPYSESSTRATVWINGAVATLRGITGPFAGTSANSVFVSGSDVYVAGDVWPGNVPKAGVWKNGAPTSLTNFESFALSVYVSGSDVYVAGTEWAWAQIPIATIWKNGAPTSLSNFDSFALSVCVSGSDVYVAGNEWNGTTQIAKIWKNGVATSLTDGPYSASATSVFVLGSDVYVAGYESNATAQIAKIWKNGVATSLTDGTHNARAASVFVSGSDVYVAGYEANATAQIAKVWKNGVATSLTDGTVDAAASSVFITE